MLDDNNDVVASRIVYISKNSSVCDLKSKLNSNRQQFKYENQDLWFQKDLMSPGDDIRLDDDAAILKDTGITSIFNDIYFFRD